MPKNECPEKVRLSDAVVKVIDEVHRIKATRDKAQEKLEIIKANDALVGCTYYMHNALMC